MLRTKRLGKDHAGALMLLALGAVVLVQGLDFQFGSLSRMGAGFIPVVIGVLLMLVGLAIGVTAGLPKAGIAPALEHDAPAGGPQYRAWLCIVGGVAAFVVLGRWGGLVPASFASVFVSALGDRDGSVKGSLLLAALLTAFCVAVFHFGLHLQLALFQWG